MAYDYEEFYNHYTDSDGNVIQQGTPLDAKHFNHFGKGIYRACLQQFYFMKDENGYYHVYTDDTDDTNDGYIDGLVDTATAHVSTVSYAEPDNEDGNGM